MKIIQIFLYSLLFFVVIIFLIISFKKNDFTWFARSGSLITVIPLLISIFEIFSDRKQIFSAKNNYARNAPPDIDEKAKGYLPIKIIVNSIITIIGTIIWGFGDLLL